MAWQTGRNKRVLWGKKVRDSAVLRYCKTEWKTEIWVMVSLDEVLRLLGYLRDWCVKIKIHAWIHYPSLNAIWLMLYL